MIVSLCLLSLIAASPVAQDPPRYTYSAELNEEQSAWVEKTLASIHTSGRAKGLLSPTTGYVLRLCTTRPR